MKESYAACDSPSRPCRKELDAAVRDVRVDRRRHKERDVDSEGAHAVSNPGLRNLIVRRKNGTPFPGFPANRLTPHAMRKSLSTFCARRRKTAIG
jgi:hypothetical protein